MPSSMTLIQTKTVSAGGSATIEFTGIPQTGFTDLQMVYSLRDTSGNTFNNVFVTFNNSTSGYSDKILYSYFSAGVLTTSNTNSTQFAFNYASGSTSTASTFGSGQMYIPNYSGSTNKSISVDSITENNGTQAFSSISSGLWSNTAAITSIKLTSAGGATFVSGSTVSLYGITKSDNTFTAKATGGVITSDVGYVYHTFTSSGTFTPNSSLAVEVLAVGGGGSSGGNSGGASTVTGGGGGGRVVYGSTTASSAQIITVGAAQTNSSFGSTFVAPGGGAGGGLFQNGYNGGSGGGGGRPVAGGGQTTPGGSAIAGTGATGLGSAGGTGYYQDSSYSYSAGGGGASTNIYASWPPVAALGSSGYLAGGGGGYTRSSGSWYSQGAAAGHGANTGGGGYLDAGGFGDSGIVIVRYLK